MADQPSIRLNKVLRELNISLDRAVEFLNQKGVDIDARPTTKIDTKIYNTLLDEFETDKSKKVASHEVGEEKRKEKESLRIIQERKDQDRLDQIAKREELKTNRISIERPKSFWKAPRLNKNSFCGKSAVMTFRGVFPKITHEHLQNECAARPACLGRRVRGS